MLVFLVSLLQSVAEDHIGAVVSLKQLLSATWRGIAHWKDMEKRAITAQVKVDPAMVDCLDKMYVHSC